MAATAVDARDRKLAADVVKAGICSEEQAQEALAERAKEAAGGGAARSLAEILQELGHVDQSGAREVAKIAAAHKAAAFAAAGETKRREKSAAPAGPIPAGDLPVLGTSKAVEIARLKIPGYEILDLLGKGGMGAVYKARQKSLDRIVALKVLSPDVARDETYLKRFTTEARALARLNHENIIAGIDVGEANGYRYFAMEYVEGESLAQTIEREGALPEKRAVTIAMQIARALAHADKNALVHRDVKPQNIMVGRNDVAKLCDLGLAMTAEERKEARERGQSIGTPHYISPEQARGEHRVDIRSDIYSLGATLYHATTGETPFSGSSPMVLMTKHLTEEPVSPRKRNPKIGKQLDALIMKMLAKDKDERYQNPTELLEDMERVLAGRGIEGGGGGGGGGRPAKPQRASKSGSGARKAAPKRRAPREDQWADDADPEEGDAVENERPRYVRKKANAGLMAGISFGALVFAAIVGFFLWQAKNERAKPPAPEPPSEQTEENGRISLQNVRRAFESGQAGKQETLINLDRIISQFDRTRAAQEAAAWRPTVAASHAEDMEAKPDAPKAEEEGAPPPPKKPAADESEETQDAKKRGR